jgi:hypothetical protein
MKSTIITTHLPPRLSRRVAVDEEPLFFCTKIPPSFFCNVRLFFYFLLFLIEKLLWWPETRRQQTPLNRVVAFYLIYIFWEWISLFYMLLASHTREQSRARTTKGDFHVATTSVSSFWLFLLSDRVLLTAYTLLIYDRRRSQKVEYCSS